MSKSASTMANCVPHISDDFWEEFWEELLGNAFKTKNNDASVKDDIFRAIAPHRHSRQKPKFSMTELTIMAVLCLGGKDVRDRDISNWIVDNVKYYTVMARDSFYLHSGGLREARTFDLEARQLYRHRRELHDQFEVPLFMKRQTGLDCPVRFSVSNREGRIYLRDVLESRGEGVFRLLDLPPEIRIVIYEYVFTHPASGLGFCGIDRSFKPVTRGRLLIQKSEKSNDGHPSVQKWRTGDRLKLVTNQISCQDSKKMSYVFAKPLNEILALLSVNKQIYKEAMPYFYRCNHFHVEDLYQLSRLLGACGPERWKHFTSISFWYGPAKGKFVAVKCFRALAKLKNLRYLQIEADEPDDARATPPALDYLRMVRVRKANFIGDCPKIIARAKAEMEKPEKVSVEAAGPTKRKRAVNTKQKSDEIVVDSDDESIVRKKKVKKSKAVEIAGFDG